MLIEILWPAVAALGLVLLYRGALQLFGARRDSADLLARLAAIEDRQTKSDELVNRIDNRTGKPAHR